MLTLSSPQHLQNSAISPNSPSRQNHKFPPNHGRRTQRTFPHPPDLSPPTLHNHATHLPPIHHPQPSPRPSPSPSTTTTLTPTTRSPPHIHILTPPLLPPLPLPPHPPNPRRPQNPTPLPQPLPLQTALLRQIADARAHGRGGQVENRLGACCG